MRLDFVHHATACLSPRKTFLLQRRRVRRNNRDPPWIHHL